MYTLLNDLDDVPKVTEWYVSRRSPHSSDGELHQVEMLFIKSKRQLNRN